MATAIDHYGLEHKNSQKLTAADVQHNLKSYNTIREFNGYYHYFWSWSFGLFCNLVNTNGVLL